MIVKINSNKKIQIPITLEVGIWIFQNWDLKFGI
jgi:hypothetical protein